MAQIQHMLKVELDLKNPVPELCAVVQAVIAAQPGLETAILQGVQDAIQQCLVQITIAEMKKEGDERRHGKPIRKPDAQPKNK